MTTEGCSPQVPSKTLLKIAEAMPPPAAKLLFVWSTGRCGSTLLSQLLHTHSAVTASLSEPPAIAALHKLCRENFKNDASNELWVRRFLFIPCTACAVHRALFTVRTDTKLFGLDLVSHHLCWPAACANVDMFHPFWICSPVRGCMNERIAVF